MVRYLAFHLVVKKLTHFNYFIWEKACEIESFLSINNASVTAQVFALVFGVGSSFRIRLLV